MRGLLLINLGTPDEPAPAAVRRYLRQFLSDPRVIDIHPLGKKALLELVILPTRPAQSARAYAKVWDQERGSPLLYHSRDLVWAVGEQLGEGWRVELGMRYGRPAIAAAMKKLRAAEVDRMVVFPLYPQYASSSTGSSLEEVYKEAARWWNTPWLSVVEPFYHDPLFIRAFAEVGRTVLGDTNPNRETDHVLFSFHGLPERQIRKSGGGSCLASADCCDAVGSANRNCYRAQCFATARALAQELELEAGRFTVAFQSRLGRTPWIRPYTDVVIPDLAARGVERLVVFVPSFVADCLETLEEIGIRAVEQFRAAGGQKLSLVPSLNATPAWVDAVCALARRSVPEDRDRIPG